MKRVLGALLLCASTALGQANNGWVEVGNGWGEIQNGTVPYTSPSTGTLDIRPGTLIANNLTATGLATPGAITVTPVLQQTGTINVVAGASLVDGDYFTIDYSGGTIPIEFDAAPGNGTTGGKIPYVFAPGDSAGAIRDGLIALINLAAPTAVVASIGGAAAITVTRIPTGTAGGVITENVANAGFTVAGFANPTAATTVTYKLVAKLADGTTTEAGAASSTAASVATLTAANFNRLAWSAVTGATSYAVYRTVAPTSPATTGIIYTGTALTVDDVALAGGGETAPTVDGTGVVTADSLASPGRGDAKTWYPLRFDIGIVGAGAFGATVDTTPSFSGTTDPMLNIGYNMGSQNASADGVNPAFGWALESNYQVGGQRTIELYSTLYNPSTAFGTRPYMMTYNTVTDYVSNVFTGATINYVGTYGGAPTVWVQPVVYPHVGTYADGGADNAFFEATDYITNVGRNVGLSLRKARGTFASKSAIANGDYIGYNTWSGWSGSAWKLAAYDDVQVFGTVTASAVPGKRLFMVANAAGATVESAAITATAFTLKPQALTAGTMTAGDPNANTVTTKFTWANAQVVALGAATTGDITVATFPAKTVVKNAYLVITTPDTSANALTIALGVTGADYVDLVVASDAKASANTVYGDASAERGTNLTGYFLPSFTATTAVKVHFVKTTTNLDTVLGSTGTVYLTTEILP